MACSSVATKPIPNTTGAHRSFVTSNDSLRIFLSATSRDLGSYRLALAHSLRKAGCDVKVQEDFAAYPGLFLGKLHAYLGPADVVVCLVGDCHGWQPADAALIPSPARDAWPEPLVSATEWEYFLAVDAGCDILVYLTDTGFQPDEPCDDSPAAGAAHQRYRQHLRASGRDCNVFRDLPGLTEDLLAAIHVRSRRSAIRHRPRVLPKAAQYFTGRAADVEWVRTRLQREPRVALVGPGGIGKTAIAHEAIASLSPDNAQFAHFPGGVFFHDFYASPSHLAAVEDIVAQAGLANLDDREREPRARAVLAGPRCLVYLEGCEKADDLPRFLNLCGSAAVLITSRWNADGKGGAVRHIPALAEDEAAEMLRRHATGASANPDGLPDERATIWRTTAGLLGRHPLALRLAGHRLGAGNETCGEFLHFLQQEGFNHFDDDRRSKESLELLFTHIAQSLTSDARAAWFALALHALAPIHAAPIGAAIGLGEKQTRQALLELVEHSHVDATRIGGDSDSAEPGWILAHALLREWGRGRLPDFGVDAATIVARWRGWWSTFLAQSFGESRAVGGAQRYAAMAEHFAAFTAGIEGEEGSDSIALADAYKAVGNVHRFMGRYAAAETCLRRALAISGEALGLEHQETITSLTNLAGLLHQKGDLDAAEPLHRRAVEASEHTLGPEHPRTLTSLGDLAVCLKLQGDLSPAEAINRRVLEVRERTLGPEHPDTLVAINNLANVIKQKGDVAASEPFFRRAVQAFTRTLGPEHPHTLMSVSNLADVLRELGDLAASEPLCRHALEVRERTLGAEHPDTLCSVMSLALLLERSGDLPAADLLTRRVADGFRRTLLPQHPWHEEVRPDIARIQAAARRSSQVPVREV